MLIILLFFLSLLLRIYNLDLVPFSSDSGRDFLITWNSIQTHHLPLVGPPTSLGWLHLGPLVYYIWIPILALFRGDPQGIALFTAFIDSLVTPFIYYFFSKAIGRKASSLAALFYATSPFIIIWARTPLHPSLAPIFSVTILILLTKWKDSPAPRWCFLIGLASGLLLQLHLSSIILIFFTFVYVLQSPRRLIKLNLVSLCMPIFLTLFPLLFSDAINRFSMMKKLLPWVPYRILATTGLADSRHLLSIGSIADVTQGINEILRQLFYPENTTIYVAIIFSLFIGLLIKQKRLGWFPRFCILIAVSSVFAFILFGSVQEHYLTFLLPIISLLFAASISGLSRLFGKVSIIAFLLIISLNIFNLINRSYYLSLNANSSSRYSLPLQTQEKIVDWIASRANNQSFSLHPRPDIVNLPDYLDNYLYLFLWRWHKTPSVDGDLVFTVYDIWPYPILTIPPKSEIKLFSASAVVLAQEQK